MLEGVVLERFKATCQRAREISKDECCTIHVNALVAVGSGGREFDLSVSFVRSDWYSSECTVRTYTKGFESEDR